MVERSTAARSVSEAEFLTMFRAEAAALMALPPHKHIARFVTFDRHVPGGAVRGAASSHRCVLP